MNERLDVLDLALKSLKERELDPESAGGAVALKYLLLEQQSPRPSPAAPSDAPTVGVADETPGGADPIARLSRWVGATPAQISDVFVVDEDSLTIGVPTPGLPKSKADKQRALALLLIAGERVAFERESIPAQAVNRAAEHYAVLDQNLPKNVATQSHLITRRGKRGSWQYRVTQPGLEKAAEMVKTLINQEGPIEV